MDESSLMYGLLNPNPVRRLLESHQSGRQDNHKLLFSLVMIEQWLRARPRRARAHVCGIARDRFDSFSILGEPDDYLHQSQAGRDSNFRQDPLCAVSGDLRSDRCSNGQMASERLKSGMKRSWKARLSKTLTSFITGLRESNLKADIFTFAQRPPEITPRYNYHWERDNWAAIPTTCFKDWWETLPQEARKNVRRSARRGLVVKDRTV